MRTKKEKTYWQGNGCGYYSSTRSWHFSSFVIHVGRFLIVSTQRNKKQEAERQRLVEAEHQANAAAALATNTPAVGQMFAAQRAQQAAAATAVANAGAASAAFIDQNLHEHRGA